MTNLIFNRNPLSNRRERVCVRVCAVNKVWMWVGVAPEQMCVCLCLVGVEKVKCCHRCFLT